MSTLGAYLTNKLVTWIDVEGYDGFKVKVAYLSRQELTKIKNAATRHVFNPKVGAKEETIDNDLFVKSFVSATVEDWEGFTLEHALNLLPITPPESADLGEKIEFTEDEALFLVKESPTFDSWLNDIVFDLSRFPRETTKETKRPIKKVS